MAAVKGTSFLSTNAVFNNLPVEILELILTEAFDFARREYYLKADQLEFFSKNFSRMQPVLNKVKTSYLFEKVFKIVLGFLEAEEIFKCRIVCKRWTKAVDGFLERPSCFEPYLSPSDVLTRKYSFDFHMQYPVDLSVPRKLDYMEKAMDSVTSNPFVGRNIEISPKLSYVGEGENESLESLCRILDRLGKYVWHLKWYVAASQISAVSFYATLYRIIHLLPNLKTLQVSCWINDGEKEILEPASILYLDSHKLPKIDSLYYVHLSVGPLPFEMENAIISSLGFGLRKLALPLNKEEVGRCFHFDLLNVKELYMWNIKTLREFSNLVLKIKNANIPLEKFKLKLSSSFGIYDLLEILRPLNLKVVSFCYTKLTEQYNEYTVSDESRLDLFDSIRTVEIRDSLALNYNFLKYLPNLEYLYLKTCYDAEVTFLETQSTKQNESNILEVVDYIRLCLYTDKLPAPEFWSLFPNLKYIIVEYSNGDYGCIFPCYLERPLLRYPRCLSVYK